MARFSKAMSAYMRLSFSFSSWSSFKRLMSEASMPPNLERH